MTKLKPLISHPGKFCFMVRYSYNDFWLRKAEPTMFQNKPDSSRILIDDIIDGMYDWVRVIDRENNIVFVNKAMEEAFKDCHKGEKCFRITGRADPCENCTSQKAVFSGHPHLKEEVIKDRIFSVMSSPLKNEKGEIFAAVEVLRDITDIKNLQKTVLEQNRRLQDNLDIAKKLQCSLLPKGLSEDKIEFSFIYQPCEELGGDFFDIFRIDEDNIGFYIADVSGHGVSASLLTVFLRSAIDKKNLSPAAVLTDLFSKFNSNAFDHEVYITVFYAIIDLKDGTVSYSNAGHNVCPIVFNLTDSRRFEILTVPGIPISNWLASPDYSNNLFKLSEGDRIFLSTDGIIELKNRNMEQFGEDRLQKILINDTSEPQKTLNKIIKAACEFSEISDITKFPDDITMALIEIKA